jgi:polyphosphate kinase
MPRLPANAGSLVGAESSYINRELSWLDFNARVLSVARDRAQPLLERAKFCGIFASNLDEFFEVRVAGIKDQVAAGLKHRSVDGLRPDEQLRAITSAATELMKRQAQTYANLVPELAEAGVVLAKWSDLTQTDHNELANVFAEGIFPVLTPLAVDPGHPFPYISNLSLNLAAVVRDPTTDDRRFARVKVPPLLPRFIGLADGKRWIRLEELIAAQLPSLFPGMDIESSFAFRVTRNADLSLSEGEADDLLAAVETELRRRRFGNAVRLEVEAAMPDHILSVLLEELELNSADVYRIEGPIDLTGLSSLVSIDRPDLKDDPWSPRTQRRLQGDADSNADVDMFAEIRASDLLVHHPYDSFSSSVERFIQQAATDPDVLSIKLTLYRTSGNSAVVRALIDAAERGKQVAALVELKARFDEQANIAWARKLEEAGVHVVYGLVGLKTHTKVALVVRAEPSGLRRYCHLSTGNYNSSTARIYEDIGLFTASPSIGDDLIKLFNGLTGFARPVDYSRLITAPSGMREKVIELIRNEMPRQTATGATSPGSIVMKMNSLVDQPIIDALYEASQAGVHVDLIIRGICCLRPGVPGLSDNIRVRSIIGRFLEHSRIWKFQNGGTYTYYFGSADMMPRNLDRRIEAVVTVDDVLLQTRIDDLLEILLKDNELAWNLEKSGEWNRLALHDSPTPFNSQQTFMRQANARSAVVGEAH